MNRKHTILIGLVALALAVATVYGAMTNSATEITQYPSFITSGNQYMNPVYRFCNEIEGYAEGTSAWPATLANVEVFDANDTLTAAETGKICVSEGHGTAANIVFTLPSASAGLTFTFVDANATAADDVWITAAAGDTVNGGTAAKSYKCITDSAGQSVTLVAADATQWLVVAEKGTWANDNN